jgi:hypothetical protein
MRRIAVLAGLLVLALTGWAGDPIEKYRKLEFPPSGGENFEKGWKERVLADYAVINDADLKSLRAALGDGNPFVRAIAAYALGVRGDKTSADALAELVKNDKEYVVRIRALEALAMLKMKPEIFASAKKDRDAGVPFVANLVAGQLKSEKDYAAEIRQAYAAGIKLEEMGSAVVGKPAPAFTALTIDGKTFELSSVLGKKPIAIYFAAFDG